MQYINLLATCKYKQATAHGEKRQRDAWSLVCTRCHWLVISSFGATRCFNACVRCFITDARRWNVPANMQNNKRYASFSRLLPTNAKWNNTQVEQWCALLKGNRSKTTAIMSMESTMMLNAECWRWCWWMHFYQLFAMHLCNNLSESYLYFGEQTNDWLLFAWNCC